MSVAAERIHRRPRQRAGPRRRVLLATWYYDAEIHTGIARYAAEAGWTLHDETAQVRGVPSPWKGDGVLAFHGYSQPHIDFLNQQALNMPVVDIGEYDHLSTFPRVRTDAGKIAKAAVEYFAGRGFQHVGFIDSTLQKRRRAAMQFEADRLGLDLRVLSMSTLDEAMPNLPLPIGITAATDGIAVQAMVQFEQAGILVPEQVALLGIDNDLNRCLPAPVQLSSVDTDRVNFGYTAAALLDRMMSGEAAPAEPIDVPPRGIVERESTNILAVSDVDVATALRFIFQNFRTDISVADVADYAGVSLRRLQTRFQAALGRTILEMINGRRVEHAREMLTRGSQKMRVIALESGFGDATRFLRAFRRYTSQSPMQYRRQHGV